MPSTSMRHGTRGERLSPRGYSGPGSYDNGQYAGSYSGSQAAQTPGYGQSSWSQAQGSGSNWAGQPSSADNGGYQNQQQSWNQQGTTTVPDNGQYHPGQYNAAEPSSTPTGTAKSEATGQSSTSSQYEAQAPNNGQYNSGQYQSNQQSGWNKYASPQQEQEQSSTQENGQYQPNQQSYQTQHGPAQVPDNGQYHPWQYTGQYMSQDDTSQQTSAEQPASNPASNPAPQQDESNTVASENTNSSPSPAAPTTGILQTSPTTQPPMTGTLLASPTATTGSHQTLTPITTPHLDAASSNAHRMAPGEQAALAISVIAIVAIVGALILCPIRKRHKYIQAALGKNPKWKLDSETDSEKATGAGYVEPIRQFASGMHAKGTTTVHAAAAFLKPKSSAATDAVYTQCQFAQSWPINFDDVLASNTAKTREIEDGRNTPSGRQSRKVSLTLKMPLISSNSNSSLSDATSNRKTSESAESGFRSGQITPGSSNYSRTSSAPRSPGPKVTSPLEPLQVPPTARSLSSSTTSTAWGSRAPSPVPSSQGSRVGSCESPRTGNLLSLNPLINEQYLVELDFQPANPGQLQLRAGEAIGIAQVFDNGWALGIRVDCSEAGLVPRSHLATSPTRKAVHVENKRHSVNPPTSSQASGLSSLAPRFYSFFGRPNTSEGGRRSWIHP